MNIDVEVPKYSLPILLDIERGAELLCIPFWGTAKPFSTAMYRGPNFSTTSPTHVIFHYFNNSQPNEWEVVSMVVLVYTALLMMKNISACVYWPFVYPHWGSVVQILGPFLNWVVQFLLLSCSSSLHILEVNPLYIYDLKIFSHFVGSIHCVDSVLWWTNMLNFNEVHLSKFSSVAHAFDVISTNPLPNLSTQRITSMFSSKCS